MKNLDMSDTECKSIFFFFHGNTDHSEYEERWKMWRMEGYEWSLEASF